MYVNEIKKVRRITSAKHRKNAGGGNEGMFHDVVENKWRKDVRK